MSPLLVLLRGVNVGGRARLPMAELRAALSDAGLADVRTHLQSGNLLIREPSDRSIPLAGAVEQVIEDRFGLQVRAMTRTREEVSDVVGRNPFLEPGVSPTTIHTVFLEADPGSSRVAGLDPDRSPPDRFVVSGREIYVHYPGGSGRSKLALDYFERRLGVVGTARNWNTVTKLLELLSA